MNMMNISSYKCLAQCGWGIAWKREEQKELRVLSPTYKGGVSYPRKAGACWPPLSPRTPGLAISLAPGHKNTARRCKVEEGFWLKAATGLLALGLVSPGGWQGSLLAAEKLRFATAIRVSPLFFLPPLAAQEQGFWKQEGIDGEWIGFRSGSEQARAVAAKVIFTGMFTAVAQTIDRSRGLPMFIIADLDGFQEFYFYVMKDSKIQGAQDFKGSKIGVTRLGALTHVYGIAVFRSLGLEGQVKHIAVGGTTEKMAALKAGTTDTILLSSITMARFEVEGLVRRVMPLSDYIPKEWDPLTVYATREFIDRQPETVKKVVKVMLRSTDFIMRNPSWSIKRSMTEVGWTEEVARIVYGLLTYSKDGTIHLDRLRGLRNFLVQYEVVAKEKAPAAEELFAKGFVRVQ